MLLYIYKNVFSHTICKLDNSGEMSVGGGGGSGKSVGVPEHKNTEIQRAIRER
jgi:hypothetical protein